MRFSGRSRSFQREAKAGKQGEGSGRATWVAAVIFLLFGGLAIKLVYLQVIRHQHYAEAAFDQHAMAQSLAPERGKIYIQDNYLSASSALYPIAINRDFAAVFAIPKNIAEVEPTVEKLYTFFKEEQVKKDVEARIQRERADRLKKELEYIKTLPVGERAAKEAEARSTHEALMHDPVYLDFENEKREELIKEGKQIIVDGYTAALSKPDDVYESIEKKVDEETLKKFYIFMSGRTDVTVNDLQVKDGAVHIKSDNSVFPLPGFGFAMVPFRYYPEKNIGANLLGFASYENEEQRGHYGLEGFFDDDLYGASGSVTSERGAGGTVIINDRQYNKKTDGQSLVLTLDRSAQFTACRELDEAVRKHGADGGSVIILDPYTGAVLAMCSAPDFDPNDYRNVPDIKVYNNPAIFDEYEPGSVFKAITMAAALDQEKVTPETTYQDNGQIMIKGWPKPIRNSDYETHGGHGKTNMVTVLEQSLNTGAIFAMEQTGARVFSEYVEKFGFGEKTGIELEGESDGNIKSLTGARIAEISAATASFGQGITVTPLQMAVSYAALANGGNLVKPYIVKEIISADGNKIVTQPSAPRRVISERAASLVTGMLVNVVEKGHSKNTQVAGYYIAGKTGTAQVASSNGTGYSGRYNHTFVGYAPANHPKFVILTKIDNPKDARFAESTAVPLAHDVTKFLLNQWQVPKERLEEKTTKK